MVAGEGSTGVRHVGDAGGVGGVWFMFTCSRSFARLTISCSKPLVVKISKPKTSSSPIQFAAESSVGSEARSVVVVPSASFSLPTIQSNI